MQPSTACLWIEIKYPDKSTGQYGSRIVLPWIYVNDKNCPIGIRGSNCCLLLKAATAAGMHTSQ